MSLAKKYPELEPATVERIAVLFAGKIIGATTGKDWDRIKDHTSGWSPDDFCDANQLMLDACDEAGINTTNVNPRLDLAINPEAETYMRAAWAYFNEVYVQ